MNYKKLRPTTNYEKQIFKQILGKDVDEVYEPVGCDKCNRGFKGRIALHEVLFLTDKLRDLINNEDTDKEELRKAVYDDDTTTLLQDALEKVIEGYTTFKEVYKVVDIDFDIEKSIRKEIKKKEKVEQAKVKLEIIDLFTDDEGSEGTIEISKKEMEKIKKKAREAAKNKYKIKTAIQDNDLLDVFEDMPSTQPQTQKAEEKQEQKQEQKTEQKPATEKKEDKKK